MGNVTVGETNRKDWWFIARTDKKKNKSAGIKN
jgi:hypothetical protein